jgi:hypothetical protein
MNKSDDLCFEMIEADFQIIHDAIVYFKYSKANDFDFAIFDFELAFVSFRMII